MIIGDTLNSWGRLGWTPTFATWLSGYWNTLFITQTGPRTEPASMVFISIITGTSTDFINPPKALRPNPNLDQVLQAL